MDLQAVSDAVQAGALTNLQHLSLSAHAWDRLPIIKWPDVLLLRVNCIVENSSSDFVKIFERIAEAIEKERFPKLQSLRMRSNKENIVYGRLRFDEVFQVLMEDQPRNSVMAFLERSASIVAEMFSPLLNKYMASQNREERQRYMKEVATFSSVMKESLNQMLPKLGFEFVEATEENQNSDDYSSSQSSEVQTVKDTVRDVSAFLHDCVRTFPYLSQACRSLLNRLLDAAFTVLQNVLEGKRLDLQPLCNLLQDSLDYIPYKAHRPFLKSLLGVSLRNVEMFCNEGQCNWQPVKDILNDWIETTSNLSKTNRSYLKSLLTIGTQRVQIFDEGKPLDLSPLCRVLHDFIDNSLNLSKVDVYFLKSSTDFWSNFIQAIINDELNPESILQIMSSISWMPDPYR